MLAWRPIACAMLGTLLATSSTAHVGETGQDYRKYRQKNGIPCCTKDDCRPTTFSYEPDGTLVMYPEGHKVVVPRTRLHERPSDDGGAHWCGQFLPSGESLTFCAILPQQSVQQSPSGSHRAPTELARLQ